MKSATQRKTFRTLVIPREGSWLSQESFRGRTSDQETKTVMIWIPN